MSLILSLSKALSALPIPSGVFSVNRSLAAAIAICTVCGLGWFLRERAHQWMARSSSPSMEASLPSSKRACGASGESGKRRTNSEKAWLASSKVSLDMARDWACR